MEFWLLIHRHFRLVQLEDVNGLRVGAEGQEVTVLAEGQAVDVSAPLDSPPELHQPRPVLHTEDPDDCPPLGGGGQLGSCRVESNGRQGRVVSGDHQLGLQVEGIKELDLPRSGGARVGEEAVVAVDTEGTQTPGVGGSLSYRVENLHVSNVVNVERLLETDHQPSPVELDCQDSVTVAVLTYLRPLLEVADSQSPGGGLGHEGQERGGEQSLNYCHVPGQVNRTKFFEDQVMSKLPAS